MPRTIIISNRLPVTFEHDNDKLVAKPSGGGLATGLSSFYKNEGNLWIGWPGLVAQNAEEEKHLSAELQANNMRPVFLTNKDLELFYEGYSNATLWPAFHYFSQNVEFDDEFWESYKEVNKKYAAAVNEVIDGTETIWIHDYQLYLLPQLLRKDFPDVTIGFFQHIPFPSFEIFRMLPQRRELLQGVLGADLIGFHTYDDTRHFLSSVSRLIGKGNSQGIVEYGNRVIRVDSFPMGIDYEKYKSQSSTEETREREKRYRASFGDQKILLSVDRLDYSKGIPNRLEAFELFLELFPEYAEKVSLLLVVVPSRDTVEEYAKLKEEIDLHVGRINGKFSRIHWTPIHYYYRSLPLPALSSFYRMADVALITPLRDGMNLVCKEYVATREDMHGVLVLSEMAGASKELSDAILVNPYNIEKVAIAIHEALTMSEDEQARRLGIMQASLKRYNVFKWAEVFMNELQAIKKKQFELHPVKWDSEVFDIMKEKFHSAGKRVFFLDYDGTLVDFNNDPLQATPTRELLDILKEITRDDKNTVVLISGRKRDFLEEAFKGIPLDLIAEHGVWLKHRNKKWKTLTTLDNDWKAAIKNTLEFYVTRTPGSFIEEKDYSMVWHFRKTETGLGEMRSRELTSELNYLARDRNLRVLGGKMVVEIKSTEVDKGRAAKKWLDKSNYDFVLAIGDDWTDEDTFRAMPADGFTIKVGGGISNAKFSIEDFEKVHELLKKLTS